MKSQSFKFESNARPVASIEGTLAQPIENKLTDKLIPGIMKLLSEMEIKNIDFDADSVKFTYNGYAVKIAVTAKKV